MQCKSPPQSITWPGTLLPASSRTTRITKLHCAVLNCRVCYNICFMSFSKNQFQVKQQWYTPSHSKNEIYIDPVSKPGFVYHVSSTRRFSTKRQKRNQSANNVLEKKMPKERLEHRVLRKKRGGSNFWFCFPASPMCRQTHTHKIKSASLREKSSGFDLTQPDINIFKVEQLGIFFLTFCFCTCISFVIRILTLMFPLQLRYITNIYIAGYKLKSLITLCISKYISSSGFQPNQTVLISCWINYCNFLTWRPSACLCEKQGFRSTKSISWCWSKYSRRPL